MGITERRKTASVYSQLVCEPQIRNWPYKNRNISPSQLSLDHEICSLRKEMEDLVMREKSLTADPVIRLSCMLDQKIFEYMKESSKK